MYHRDLMKLMKNVQIQLADFEERLQPIFYNLRRLEEKLRHGWIRIQGEMLEDRMEIVRNPPEGRLFRGINPDLALVLSGLLGMQGGGRCIL